MDTLSNFSGLSDRDKPTPPNQNTNTRIPLTLLVITPVVILVILLSMFIFKDPLTIINDNKEKSSKLVNQSPTDQQKLPSSTSQVVGYQEEALKKNKKYSGYVSIFNVLYSEYLTTSNAELRSKLENTKKLAQTSYANEYNKQDFIIPCFDTDCVLIDLDPPVLEIINIISNVPKKNNVTYSLAINKLKSLKYFSSMSTDEQFYMHNDAFKSVLSLYISQNSSGADIGKSLQALKSIISNKFPEQYQVFDERNYYDF